MGELKQYKCPNCGGAIEFDSKSQKAKCPYCDTEFDIKIFEELENLEAETIQSSDEPVWDTEAGSQWSGSEEGSMKVYSCQSCGGEIYADANTAALKCPYCDNPIVFTGNLSGTLKPDLIIPFKLDKKEAKKRLFDHFKGKPLLPKVFKDQNHIDEIKGVYVPFWLFDGNADGEVHYRGTKTRVWNDSEYTYTETSHYKIFRAGNMSFENIPVVGSAQMSEEVMESLEPFDYSQAVDFKTAYLAGYLADKYDVTAENSKDRAQTRITNTIQESLKNSVSGFETLVEESKNLQLRNSNAKYVLLPVWLLNTTYDNKKYLFAMNGQTGKFVGDLPVDKSLYWVNFGKTAAIATVAMFALTNIIAIIL